MFQITKPLMVKYFQAASNPPSEMPTQTPKLLSQTSSTSAHDHEHQVVLSYIDETEARVPAIMSSIIQHPL